MVLVRERNNSMSKFGYVVRIQDPTVITSTAKGFFIEKERQYVAVARATTLELVDLASSEVIIKKKIDIDGFICSMTSIPGINGDGLFILTRSKSFYIVTFKDNNVSVESQSTLAANTLISGDCINPRCEYNKSINSIVVYCYENYLSILALQDFQIKKHIHHCVPQSNINCFDIQKNTKTNVLSLITSSSNKELLNDNGSLSYNSQISVFELAGNEKAVDQNSYFPLQRYDSPVYHSPISSLVHSLKYPIWYVFSGQRLMIIPSNSIYSPFTSENLPSFTLLCHNVMAVEFIEDNKDKEERLLISGDNLSMCHLTVKCKAQNEYSIHCTLPITLPIVPSAMYSLPSINKINPPIFISNNNGSVLYVQLSNDKRSMTIIGEKKSIGSISHITSVSTNNSPHNYLMCTGNDESSRLHLVNASVRYQRHLAIPMKKLDSLWLLRHCNIRRDTIIICKDNLWRVYDIETTAPNDSEPLMNNRLSKNEVYNSQRAVINDGAAPFDGMQGNLDKHERSDLADFFNDNIPSNTIINIYDISNNYFLVLRSDKVLMLCTRVENSYNCREEASVPQKTSISYSLNTSNQANENDKFVILDEVKTLGKPGFLSVKNNDSLYVIVNKNELHVYHLQNERIIHTGEVIQLLGDVYSIYIAKEYICITYIYIPIISIYTIEKRKVISNVKSESRPYFCDERKQVKATSARRNAVKGHQEDNIPQKYSTESYTNGTESIILIGVLMLPINSLIKHIYIYNNDYLLFCTKNGNVYSYEIVPSVAAYRKMDSVCDNQLIRTKYIKSNLNEVEKDNEEMENKKEILKEYIRNYYCDKTKECQNAIEAVEKSELSLEFNAVIENYALGFLITNILFMDPALPQNDGFLNFLFFGEQNGIAKINTTNNNVLVHYISASPSAAESVTTSSLTNSVVTRAALSTSSLLASSFIGYEYRVNNTDSYDGKCDKNEPAKNNDLTYQEEENDGGTSEGQAGHGIERGMKSGDMINKKFKCYYYSSWEESLIASTISQENYFHSTSTTLDSRTPSLVTCVPHTQNIIVALSFEKGKSNIDYGEIRVYNTTERLHIASRYNLLIGEVAFSCVLVFVELVNQLVGMNLSMPKSNTHEKNEKNTTYCLVGTAFEKDLIDGTAGRILLMKYENDNFELLAEKKVDNAVWSLCCNVEINKGPSSILFVAGVGSTLQLYQMNYNVKGNKWEIKLLDSNKRHTDVVDIKCIDKVIYVADNMLSVAQYIIVNSNLKRIAADNYNAWTTAIAPISSKLCLMADDEKMLYILENTQNRLGTLARVSRSQLNCSIVSMTEWMGTGASRLSAKRYIMASKEGSLYGVYLLKDESVFVRLCLLEGIAHEFSVGTNDIISNGKISPENMRNRGFLNGNAIEKIYHWTKKEKRNRLNVLIENGIYKSIEEINMEIQEMTLLKY